MPKHICSICKRLSDTPKHPACKKAQYKERDAQRPSAWSRGYDAQYQANRAVLMRETPWCLICGSQSNLEADHKTPLSKGGTNDIENLVILCRAHNRSKGDKTLDEFLASMN